MVSRILRRGAPLLAVAALAAAGLYVWGSEHAATPAFSFGGYQSYLPNGDYLFSNPAKMAGSNTCLLCHGWNAATPGTILPSGTAGFVTAALKLMLLAAVNQVGTLLIWSALPLLTPPNVSVPVPKLLASLTDNVPALMTVPPL